MIDLLRHTSNFQARHLIAGMLQRDPAQRFGRGGSQEIKAHPFFKSLNWQVTQFINISISNYYSFSSQDLAEKKIKAPWKPNLKSVLDTSYFDPEFTKLPAQDTPSSKPTNLRASVQDKFVGFTYVPDE